MHHSVNSTVKCCFSAIKTKIELYSHADTVVAIDQCLVICDRKRPVIVSGYNHKVGLKHSHVVGAAVAHDEPKMGQIIIILINQTFEMNGLDHHFLCPMQSNETTHATQIMNPFNATHSITIPLKLTGITSYFVVRKTT